MPEFRAAVLAYYDALRQGPAMQLTQAFFEASAADFAGRWAREFERPSIGLRRKGCSAATGASTDNMPWDL